MKSQLWILALVILCLVVGCNGSNSPTAPDDVPSTSESPQEVAGDPVMVTPYVRARDVATISAAYSSGFGNPWDGNPHPGIDFNIRENLRPFRAVFSGTIGSIELWQNDINGFWQVDVTLVFNSRYSAYYAFEPMTGARADGQTQLDNILVSVGQSVSRGDLIGNLLNSGEGAHVHWGLFDDANNTDICPESFFTDAARESILNIINRDHPDWEMCY
jgi:murein DD-endopeptidase MepM/ murein hydrolase activator NlpD